MRNITLTLGLLCIWAMLACAQTVRQKTPSIQIGAAQFDAYLPLIQHKNVALVVNHTTTIGKTHLVDTLLAQGIHIKKIFAPEHGFRGTASAGEHINNSVDAKTGLPLISLYGKNKKPSAEQLADIDVVLFDIQDVGTRFYTYTSTMHYVMEACAENQKTMLVLDRPNPNGKYIDGPVLEKPFASFVGLNPVPILHGCTVAELALMINGEGWLQNGVTCKLEIVKCKNYTHQVPYILPIAPSPNLPNQQSILLYPSLCLFEPTQVSVGRGTDLQFQVIGTPFPATGMYQFTPVDKPGAVNPPNEGILCYGLNLAQTDASQMGLDLHFLLDFYQKVPDKTKFYTNAVFFDRLAGTDQLRKQLAEGWSETQIKASWQPALQQYKTIRAKYLLYP